MCEEIKVKVLWLTLCLPMPPILHTMLKAHGDWMDLGGADWQKPPKDGIVTSACFD